MAPLKTDCLQRLMLQDDEDHATEVKCVLLVSSGAEKFHFVMVSSIHSLDYGPASAWSDVAGQALFCRPSA